MKEYTNEWNKVETALKKGLTATANTEVKGIYEAALKENNAPQIIKSAMHFIGFRSILMEESELHNHFFLDTLISQTKAPAKNILQSMQAELLFNYLQQNRWRFYNRTEQVTETAKDIQTWSLGKLHQTIRESYRQSLTNSSLLQKTSIAEYDPIILKGENTDKLRPTIYDILAFRALAYLSQSEQDISQPAYKFKMEEERIFADAKTFVSLSFKTKDTASTSFAALQLYQQVLQFHLSDTNPGAFIDADILRLQFVNSMSVLPQKSVLYRAALENITKNYPNHASSAEAGYLLAQEMINAYKLTPEEKDNYSKAKSICDAIVAKFPASEGGQHATNLLKEITRKSLQFNLELVNLPNAPFRSLLSYKNIDKAYFRIIKTNKTEIEKLQKTDYEKIWKAYVNMPVHQSFMVNLPGSGDYQSHRTEMKIDGLPTGMYILLASSNADFSTTGNILVRDLFHVSAISLIQSGNEYHVLHRNTGQPLANANVQSREYYYDYDVRRYVDRLSNKYTTDKNGYFQTVSNSKENRELRFEISTKEDYLNLQSNFYNYYNGYENEKNPINDRAFLFTDRSIYRPGQMVYFKGLVIHETTNPYKATVVANKKVTLQLMDANYQKVTSLDLVTNVYGSYQGVFTLPDNGLTGQFQINDQTNHTVQYLKVEEYKRPKFAVTIEKPKNSYKLMDSIRITGIAKAYAGNNIDGAKVKYRVVRKVQYPIWWEYGFYRGGRSIYNPYNRGEEMEITNGEMLTNAKGEFSLSFKALPDESVQKESQPIFNFEINADITDINGETRTGQLIVPVSYQALHIKVTAPEQIVVDSFQKIQIVTTNTNGVFEPANLNLKIFALEAPKNFLRTRYWEAPDQFMLKETEYKKLFPNDVYDKEDQKSNWKKLNEVYNQFFTTIENKEYNFSGLKITPGFYIIEITGKDKYGEPVKAIQYIELTSEKMLHPYSGAISLLTKKQILQPGENAVYTIASAFDQVFAIHEANFIAEKSKVGNPIVGKRGLQWRFYEQVQKTAKSFTIPVAETDRGGMGIQVSFVKLNQVFTMDLPFSIPWTNKELKISVETFRDKTLPGSMEENRIKISGAKGEKIAAEMLATMYDASLDQIQPHQLHALQIYPSFYGSARWAGTNNFQKVDGEIGYFINENYKYYNKTYASIGLKNGKSTEPLWWLNPLDYLYNERGVYRKGVDRAAGAEPMTDAAPPAPAMSRSEAKGEATVTEVLKKLPGVQNEVTVNPVKKVENNPVQIRKNFNETAFFFPQLNTDAEGNIILKYTLPEALTEWKLMAMAHTKDLALGYATKKLVTQKPLMVQPNLPRFLREGDKVELSVKVVNLTDKEITGTSQLELIDATTNKPVDGWFKNMYANQYFTVPAGQSVPVVFAIEIPYNFVKPVLIRIIAESKDIASDGEENIVPVVSNRMLVTETMPLPMRGVGTKIFKFEKLIQSAKSNSISHQGITLEYTSNPAWYAVQALPYLMEYPYECAEQTFNRYYANALASKVANSNPKIKSVFDQWASADSKELISNLSKNESLKSALLTETPWVMDAQNETQQKKNIALLFDLNRMSKELNSSIKKLKEMQSSNGGFVWFKGGREDRYITQYILTGIGHLKKLGALQMEGNNDLETIIRMAIPYLDARIKEDYDYLIKYKSNLKLNNTSYFQIQYLYMRSFFMEMPVDQTIKTAYQYYLEQTGKFWLPQNKYMQGMSALVLHRNNKKETAKAILASLKENAIINEELGMYWKEVTNGYYWHQAPIETMSLLIETFSEIGSNITEVDNLRTWLLKNKQTNNWKTTKATAEACYAFLLQGTDFLQITPVVSVQLGAANLFVFGDQQEGEAGTLYSKKRIDGDKVKADMGNVTITVANPKNIPAAKIATSWGGMYWQYFEDLDKITSAATPLQLKKKIFREVLTDKGKKLEEIKENDRLVVGDKMIIRIELKVDRDMEYIHMKDMRSSGTEPVNVLSSYKWQDGLGYYESTKDASTNFFFNYLPKGTFVFEYPLFVSHKGNFSNGITTIQCMYAPEFSSHSEGVRVKVE